MLNILRNRQCNLTGGPWTFVPEADAPGEQEEDDDSHQDGRYNSNNEQQVGTRGGKHYGFF